MTLFGTRWIKVLLPALLMAPAAGMAADIPDVRVEVKPDHITIGQPVRISLEIRAPELSRLTVADSFSADPGATWTLVEKHGATDEKDGVSGWLRRIDYTVTTFETGSVALPDIMVTYRPPDAAEVTKVATPGTVTVESVLPANTEKLEPKDIKPPVPVPFPRWVFWAAGLAALIPLALLARLLWSRLRPAIRNIASPPKRLDEWALEELALIERERLVEQKRIKEFYSRVSDTVRVFVGGLFEFDALDLTTHETLERLKESPMNTTSRERVEELLSESDLVKFAKYVPENNICHRALDRARHLVSASGHHVVQPETANASPAARPAPSTGAVRGGMA
jgi:hypothetical protein